MRTTNRQSGTRALILIASLSAAVLLWPGCNGAPAEPRTEIDLTSFKVLARGGSCTNIRNRLFLIDGQLVFWDRAGNCPDAAYGETLFGSTISDALCNFHDSIAGPIKICQDERYREMFDTIIANLDKPDLGLGPRHKVQPIPF
jgi:hypothetical protein